MNLIISLFCGICLFYGVQAGYVHDKEIKGSLKMHRIIASFEDASIRCKKEGAVLIAPTNTDIGNVLRRFISNNYKNMNGKELYYMDAKARYESGVYVNINNYTLENMMIVKSEITTLDPKDGDCIAWNIKTVKAVPCHTRLSYICFKADKKSKTEPVEQSKQSVLDCGVEGYELNNVTGSCYKFHNNQVNWQQAYWTCFHEGGYLPILNDKTEADIVMDIVYKYDINASVGVPLGLRAPEGNNADWISTDRVPVDQLFNQWSGSQGVAPSNASSRCAYLVAKDLSDGVCDGKKSQFFCEKSPVKIPLDKITTEEI